MAVTLRRAVFLDKDGTLIDNVPFNTDPDQIRLTPGMPQLLRALQRQHYLLVVVTNQAGVARGLITPADMERLRARLDGLLEHEGIRLDGYYACPHHPEGTVETYRLACKCRKPRPGLLLQAARDLSIDLSASWMIGDILDDVEAGNRAGCRSILYRNGNETEWEITPMRTPRYIVDNLTTVRRIILQGEPAAKPQPSDVRTGT